MSKLLTKTTNGTVTKYVYGRGLIGEQTGSAFKTYHFDCRGSTVAITDANGNITDTFAYDTYGNLASRTGTSKVIFLYNGRDGVITDDNGLYYMRARYYSPEMRRFVNADVVAGEISDAITLNRFAYANGNPVSNIDPLGLSSDVRTDTVDYNTKSSDYTSCPYGPCQMCMSHHDYVNYLAGLGLPSEWNNDENNNFKDNEISESEKVSLVTSVIGNAGDMAMSEWEKAAIQSIKNTPKPNNIGYTKYSKWIQEDIATVKMAKNIYSYAIPVIFTVVNTGMRYEENVKNKESKKEIVSDAMLDIGSGAVAIGTTLLLAKIGTAISPGIGTLVGIGVGLLYDYGISPLLDKLI